MNKNQTNKRTKRNQVSKRKKKQRNIDQAKRKKMNANDRKKLMQLLTSLSEIEEKEAPKNISKEEQ